MRVSEGCASRLARDEDLRKGPEERGVEKPPLVVARLGPGIRKEEVEPRHGLLWKEPLHAVARIEPQHLHVLQSEPLHAAAHFAHPAEEPLDPEEAVRRELLRHGQQEGSVPAAEIDLDRSRPGEQLGSLQPAEIIPGDELVRFGIAIFHRGLRHAGPHGAWFAR